MWRIIFAVPCWVIYQIVIFLPLVILGWFFVPLAAACSAYTVHIKDISVDKSGIAIKKVHFTWDFMWIWDNYEDGIANDSYVKFDSMFMRIVYWSCLRNPVNNLRIVPILSCKIVPSKVQFVGSFGDSSIKYLPADEVHKYDTKIPQWFFAWQNIWHSNFYWQFKAFKRLWRFWLGNAKIYPTDIYGVSVDSYRGKGAGPVAQFKRVKT